MRIAVPAFCAFLALAAAATPAHADAVTVTRDACQVLTRHVPDPDVTYQPGVDVNGKAVAPADLPPEDGGSPPIDVGTSFEIPLTVNLARELHIPMGMTRSSKAVIGMITVDGNNVYFNGQPLNDDAQSQLSVLCLKPH